MVAIRRPFFTIKPGDVVLLSQSPYGNMIKAVESTGRDWIRVHGFHQSSVDSKTFGDIPKKRIFAKVIFKIKS